MIVNVKESVTNYNPLPIRSENRNTVLNEFSKPIYNREIPKSYPIGKSQRVTHANHNYKNADTTPTRGNLDDNICDVLSKIKTKQINVVVIGLLNINSFAGKFDSFKTIISGKVDVTIIVETKLDDSYLTSQFYIHCYSKPFRGDRNKYDGGILIYIREDIPCKTL